ncbi:hypothetical protein BG015_011908 [Linnemannia schmuckeri]|uniref:Alpha/beta hydrolase fold-3 domain-containing protein n=1 Tax=Linnemannia schmuckeri TaxID=64567 RepID=A0A9P5RVE1_9FUNG|nr:hypothetical protein BG015_011908 [Linnemannia schmuckeri]
MVSTPSTLYSPTGILVEKQQALDANSESDQTNSLSPQQLQQQRDQYILSLKQHQQHFPAPSFLQRAYLNGILHKPKDIAFLARMAWRAIYSMVRLHCVELPFLIATRFQYSSKHHPLGWPWWWTIVIALIRGVGVELKTIGHLRFVGHFMEGFLPFQMLFVRHVKVQKNVKFKVSLEALTRPERATLAHVREELSRRGVSVDIMNPSKEYLRSMHYPVQGPHAQISNMPEEVGRLDEGGIYSLKGEWIEALHHANDPRPRTSTVVLYFHGGGHAFLSPRSHRDYLARLAKEIGPGTRIFSLDYRLGPEHPFPAAIHDAFAAYLYLVQPKHEALILNNKSAAQHLPVDPRDVVVGGDSAGANLAAAFMIYLAKYVQPSMSPKYVMPHATLLLSVWADPTSSLPAANNNDWYCYCPGPIGSHPFDKKTFTDFKALNLARNYICGDVSTNANARNALGEERAWLWYASLAQHPLVSPVHRADLSGLTNTLVQTGTHDRLYDDNRLYAHRLGKENPGKLVRLETYKDQVHVHQVFSILEAAKTGLKNLARFIERSRLIRDAEEGIISQKEFQEVERRYLGLGLIKDKSVDNVEWVVVEANGKESAKDEGWPMTVLSKVWPLNELIEA